MSYEIKKDESGMVVYEAIEYEDGQVLEAEHMNRIEAYLEDIYGVLNAKPEIYCENTVLYTSIGVPVYLTFAVKARGDITVTVKRGVNSIYHKKTSEKQFNILVDTNPIQVQTVEYTIIVEDNQGNIAEVKVINQIIDATLILSNPIDDNHVIIGYDLNNSASLNLDNSLVFKVSGEQPSEYSLHYKLNDNDWVELDETATENVSNNIYTYTYDCPSIILEDEVTADSSGEITFQVRYTLKNSADTIFVNLGLTYDLIQYGTIKFITLNDINGFTSNDKFVINYKVLAPEVDQISNIRAELTENISIAQAIATVNTPYTLTFGMLPTGNYTINWYVDDELKDQTHFSIIEGVSYVKDELLAYFNATSSSSSATEWKPIEGELKDDIWFNLYGGYTWNEATPTIPNHLLLVPNSYGLLNNYNTLATELNTTSEFSLELYFYATNIGELKAPVFTTLVNNNDTSGLNILHDSAQILNAGTDSVSALLNNKWNHIVLEAVNGNDTSPKANIEDTEYYKCFKIYLNGCLVNCTYLTEEFKWLTQFRNMTQFVLNGYLDLQKQLSESGHTKYELIRIYKKALSASEVLLNYKNAISYNETLLQEVTDRNNNTSIAKIFFVKNKTPIENDSKIAEAQGYIDFSTLHTITKKKKESDSETGYFSKTSAVNCSVFLIQDDKVTKYPNMDILLQGTSSLVYPVKNYQIKNYNSKKKKSAFLPNVNHINLDTGEDWGGVEGDYVYTLKCDYMEQSHKNNTPTAIYYESVLDNIIGDNTEAYSPARKVKDKNGAAPYRDSITGFPVLVYYSNNNDDKIDLSQYDAAAEGLETTLISNCIPTGSYMFNIDKEGKALGFELEEIQGDERFNFAIKDYYIASANINATAETSTLSGIEFEDALPFSTINELNNLKLHLYCYGYTYKQSADDEEEQTDQQCWLQDCGEVEFTSDLQTLAVNYDLTGLAPFCLSEIISISRPATGYCMSLEGTANSQDYAAATFYTINDANKQREEHNNQSGITEKDKLALFTDKFSYYAATLEPRYSYADEQKYKNERLHACEYEQLDECIKFFKIVHINATKPDNDPTKISDRALCQRFEQLFSKEYCLTYYLQMMMFTQVDNAGKNAMFDSWNGGKLYPRPYDMDTQMGLDNVGADNVPVSAELFNSAIEGVAELSVNLDYRYKDEGKAVDLNEQRLTSYNTRNSRLWDFVRLKYKQDIINHYQKLRTDVYTENTICNTMNSLTSDVISESQYNQDAVLKYLLPPKEEREDDKIILKPQVDYFYVLAGNRVDRYRQYIRQRLIFLDSVYEQGTYINHINLRAEASSPSNVIKWIFSSFSPQYVSIISGQNTPAFKFYITPEMQYLIKDDIYGEGISLSYLNTSTNRETTIYGVNNLKFINNLGSAAPSTLTGLGDATKLNSFDLQNAPTQLTEIDLSNNTMLNNVNISNCQGITSLKLINATNLKEVNITNNEKLISLTLPTSAPITKIDLTNSKNLQSLTLTNLPNLTRNNLILTGCKNLTELNIVNCPLLESIDLTELDNLTKVKLDNCATLTEFKCEQHTKLSSLELKNCENLKTVKLTACKALTALDLSTGNDQISEVDVSNIETLTSILIPKNDQVKFSLNLYGCLKCNKVNSNEPGVYDFDGMKIIALQLYNNQSVTQIKNLDYHGSGKDIFYNCKNLKKIQNSELKFKTSMYRAFAYDTNLTLENTSLSMDSDHKVESCFMMCYSCSNMNQSINSFLTTFVKDNAELETLHYAFTGCGNNTNTNSNWTLDISQIPQNVTSLFACFNSTKLKTITGTLFSSLQTSLTNIGACFSGNYLETIPNGLFNKCTGIKTAYWCFANNTRLNQLPDSKAMFNENCTDIDATAMFIGCTNLKIDPTEFFKKNSQVISIADKMFRKTGINKITSGIFNNIPLLKSAIGMFAECPNITTLSGISLRDSGLTGKLQSSLVLGGLFYGCVNLTGLIPAGLFTNLKGSITSLGWEHMRDSSDISRKYDAVLGAFANTNVTGYEPETFQDMTNLANISYLFASANLATSTSVEQSTFTNREQCSFAGYGTANQIPSGTIGYNIFKNCKKISNIIGAFMGTKITRIEAPKDSAVNLLFGSNQTKIKDISALFNNSNLTNDTESGFTNLLQNLPNITNASYAFANTSLTNIDENFFENNQQLENLQGVFSGCAQITSIPLDLFKPCKSKLSNIAYAFADTGLQLIPEETPISYVLSAYEINFVGVNGDPIRTFEPNSAGNQLLDTDNNNRAIASIYVNSDSNIEIQYVDQTTSEIDTEFSEIVLKFKLNNELQETKSYQFQGSYIEDAQSNVLLFTIDTKLEPVNGWYTQSLGTYTDYNLKHIALYKKIVTSVDNSLFYNCDNLTTVRGCFFNTPITALPNYLFANNTAFEKLSTTAYMFANCTQVSTSTNRDILDSTDPELLSLSFLNTCPAITTIEGMYVNLGSEVELEDGDTFNSYKLGTAFNNLSSVSNIRCAFANIPRLLDKTVLNNGFLYNSLSKLKYCKYAFTLTPVSEISEVFNADLSGNNITEFDYAFAASANESNTTAPYASRFPKSCSSTGAWIDTSMVVTSGHNRSKLIERGWTYATYQIKNGNSVTAVKDSLLNGINSLINTEVAEKSFTLTRKP